MKAMMVGLIAALGVALCSPERATALSSPSVVISHVQAGLTGAAAQELVSIYNNSDDDVDITGWCLTNKSSTATQFKAFACFMPETENERLILAASAHAVVVTSAFSVAYPETDETQPRVYDVVIETTGGVIVATADTIGLYNADKTLIDAVDWTNLESGKVLQRSVRTDGSTGLLDTDSRTDFTKEIAPIIPLSSLTYVRILVDICGNIEAVQDVMPPGYGYDDAKNCELLSADLCENLPDIQVGIPTGLAADGSGACVSDACLNIVGIQVEAPTGYVASGSDCYVLEDRHIVITEVLANASGSDDGKEFIELYNPHEQAVLLVGYELRIGKNLETTVPLWGAISSGGRIVFSDTDLGVALLNTLNQLSIITPAGTTASTVVYSNAPEDESWSLVDGVWIYTDQPTPAAVNKGRAEIDDPQTPVLGATLSPCPAGKYRHPITNRCRNIEADTSMLVACDADEYRNPETNRCRKMAGLAVALVPCAAGYERNPATSRCRKASTTVSALKPCQSGYERNPSTNRCRKTTATVATGTAALVVPDQVQEDIPLKAALVATVGVGAVGYALYEWRSEFGRIVRRATQGIRIK